MIKSDKFMLSGVANHPAVTLGDSAALYLSAQAQNQTVTFPHEGGKTKPAQWYDSLNTSILRLRLVFLGEK